MRKTEWKTSFLLLGITSALCLPICTSATEIRTRSDTILRFFQRDTSQEEDAAVTPLYEYLQIDVDNPGEPGLAFHGYGWGRVDATDNEYYADSTAGEILYGYLEYSRAQARFNARLGRQHIFEGLANDDVDGLRISSELGSYFSGSLYAGQPAAFDGENGRSGDSIYGGRLSHHLTTWYDVGLSLKKVRNDTKYVENAAGVDFSASLPHNINFYGFSKYNLETDGWGEHSYDLTIPIGPASARPYFRKFQYDDYFDSGSKASPFRFLSDTGEELTVGGADLLLPIGKSLVLTAKAKHCDYEKLDDSSWYYGAQAVWAPGPEHTQTGGEFGYMNGDEPQNKYRLFRLFSYLDLPENWPLDPSITGDILYVGYDEDIYDKNHSLFISLGLESELFDDSLFLKLSGDYSADPYFDKDVRTMLAATYYFDKSF